MPKIASQIIDQQTLLALLRYEPETGRLFWKKRTPEMFLGGSNGGAQASCASWNKQHEGREAFAGDDGKGYRRGSIKNQKFLAHRLIFAMVHGSWPEEIDHIDGNRSNNRIDNLRAASCTENMRNRKRIKTNTSGVMGVAFNKTAGKFVARIGRAGRYVHLGYFENFDEAVAARKAAEPRHNYHANHGRT